MPLVQRYKSKKYNYRPEWSKQANKNKVKETPKQTATHSEHL